MFKAMTNQKVQEKVQSATQRLSNVAEVQVTFGPGVSRSGQWGPFGLSGGFNGPQVGFTLNPTTGETKVEGTGAGAWVKIKTPVGEAGAGASAANVKYENGNLSANVVDGYAYGGFGVEASKKIESKEKDASVKISANSDGEVSAGGNLGLFGFLIKLNPVNLFYGGADALAAVALYSVEVNKNKSGNKLINPDVTREPDKPKY
jgi:hypothetical protein